MKIIAVIIIRNFCSCEKKAWRNFRLVRDSNPWPLRYRWSTLIYVRSVSNSLRKRLCLTKNEMNHRGGICEPLYHLHQLNSFVNCTSSGSIRWKFQYFRVAYLCFFQLGLFHHMTAILYLVVRFKLTLTNFSKDCLLASQCIHQIISLPVERNNIRQQTINK